MELLRDIPDAPMGRQERHNLIGIIMIATYGVIAGADGRTEIED